jgi:hypothetical protein
VTKLKLHDIAVADRGVYRLQASNKEGEKWAYFTLNVTGEARLAMRIMNYVYLMMLHYKLCLPDDDALQILFQSLGFFLYLLILTACPITQ